MIYLFLLFLNLNIFSVEPPIEPTPPVIQNQQVEQVNTNKKGKRTVSLVLKLCDGREIIGKTEFTKDEIVFRHERDGINYTKKILLSNIKQIFIKNFSPKLQKKSSNGTTFQFDPGEIEITSHNDEIYKIFGFPGTEFQKISLNNNNGSTTLYTYWIDLQYDNGKWFSKLPTFKNQNREECHPDVVRTIKFDVPET